MSSISVYHEGSEVMGGTIDTVSLLEEDADENDPLDIIQQIHFTIIDL